jgi:hypoxanthine phosphoribosyltransferase
MVTRKRTGMKKVTLKDKTFKPLISTPTIEETTRRIAAGLNEKFKHEIEPVIFVTVLNGAVPFAASLFTKLKFPVIFNTVKLSSYQGTSSTGKIKCTKHLDNDVKGKKVIVVEDIIDTGLTIDYLKEKLEWDGAVDVTIVSLLFKLEVYKERHPEFSHWGFLNGTYDNEMMMGIVIGDEFVVGYGLDYDGLGRNLNKIYVIDSK